MRLTLIVSLVLAAAMVHGQGWSVRSLHPTGAEASAVQGISQGREIGSVWDATSIHATLWSGTATSATSIEPEGATWSAGWAIDGAQTAGTVSRPGDIYVHATLWSGGGAQTFTTGTSNSSIINGLGGGQQVGNVFNRATLWTGSGASAVNLDPNTPYGTDAYATDGTRQVGIAWDGAEHARIWSGTAASMRSLEPSGALQSAANDIRDGVIAGFARLNSVQQAGIWTDDTAESFRSLAPVDALASSIEATYGNVRAGWSVFDTIEDSDAYIRQAGVWFGGSSDFLNLHALLPSEFLFSEATDVEVSPSGDIWVVGNASRGGWQTEAFLWHFNPVPEPSFLLVLGLPVLGVLRRRRAKVGR